ncbi:MAG: extracellular solute-binding protein family 1 [Bryobacterales bacterium]|nr:extracellular solute-binding protein family 1 [Bryobacterales bacterium]
MIRRRAFVLSAAASASCAFDRRPRLNIYNWSSYIAADTIPNFERESGVRVRYGVYESNEEMLAKVMTGNSGWDIAFPTHNRIQPMAKNRLLASLDHALLPNLANLENRFQNPVWDPQLRYCIPYMWSATGIVYNRAIQPAPVGWSDLWSPRWNGRVTMLDDPEDVIGACLKKLRLPFDSIDPRELEAAKQAAIEQKRQIRAYLNAEARDQLVSGDVLAAQLWSTTSQQAMDASKALAFVYPFEGYPLYADNAVILRESTRQKLAHQFLNYLLRPEVAAAIVRTSETATCNGRAKVRQTPTLYPPPDILARGEWPAVLPASAQRLSDRIWTEIKSS